MNVLLIIGLLLVTGYTAGWLLSKIGLPKIIGYVLVGIAFSPNTNFLVHQDILQNTQPLMDVCLAIIAFEVGGALNWKKIKKHKNGIISITLFASIVPFVLILGGVYLVDFLFPALFPFDKWTLLAFALLLAALASPTAPAATLAVIHEYKAKGKVTDTILGVAALDDVLGILLFSITLGIIGAFNGASDSFFGISLLAPIYQIVVSIGIGALIAISIDHIARVLKLHSEGKWIVIIISLVILCVGLSKLLGADELLSCMTMGIVVVNRSKNQEIVFRIIERYTEDLIFLIFFLLSGLHLDISTVPQSAVMIFLFVSLRIIGKYSGTRIGARLVNADKLIQKHTAGGLIPQAGIVIGLVLSIQHKEGFEGISEILLTIIMGATVLNEVIGPIAARRSLKKAGEINIDS